MGDRTGIAWTDRTWNPWHGCTQVSPGCAHCYMFREKRQYGQNPELVVRSRTKFDAPLHWPDPARVFTCSWSDWFHVTADAWRPAAWEIIRRTPHLTYQILTKRPERIAGALPPDWGPEGYPNVWLGISAENQTMLDRRVPWLLSVPAAVRFVSAEPLLGPLDFKPRPHRDMCLVCGEGPAAVHDHPGGYQTRGLDWIIVGGESGPKRRGMRIEWAASILAQARQAGVAFFFKQVSAARPGVVDGVPPELLVQEFPAVRARVPA